MKGNGTPADEARALGPFTAVDSESTIDLSIRQGAELGVEVHLDANLIPLLTTRVQGNTLIIDSKDDLDPKIAGAQVIVTVPSLARAELGGIGHLTLEDWKSDAPIDLVLSGAGDIVFNGTAPEVDVDLSGSGDVTLSGSAQQVTIDLSGSGTLEGQSLVAQSGKVSLSGAGTIDATIAGPADVSLSGSGTIDLYGHPQITHYSDTGSGKLNLR